MENENPGSNPVSLQFNILMITFIVTTPNINNQLALPYKKRPVDTSSAFKAVWSTQKEYLRKVGGKGGLYKENKEKRKSESFPWPDSPAISRDPVKIITSMATTTSTSGMANITSIGSDIAGMPGSSTSMTSSKRSGMAMTPTPDNPSIRISPSEQHFLVKLDVLRRKLLAANMKNEELAAKVDDLHLEGCDKDAQIRSLRKRIQDLQRQILVRG